MSFFVSNLLVIFQTTFFVSNLITMFSILFLCFQSICMSPIYIVYNVQCMYVSNLYITDSDDSLYFGNIHSKHCCLKTSFAFGNKCLLETYLLNIMKILETYSAYWKCHFRLETHTGGLKF